MDAPSAHLAPRRDPPATPLAKAGYVVTNELYNTLYDLYYQRCTSQCVPCLVVVRSGGHCRLDLDMTCSQRELTDWARHSLRNLFADVPADEVYADEVYCWVTRVPNRLAEGLARGMLAVLDDDRASRTI